MWIFRQKSSQILYPPFENLTTRTTIMLNLAWYVGRLYHLAIIGCDFEITNMALAEPNHIKRNLQHTKCVLYAYQLQSYYVFKICYHYVSAGVKEWLIAWRRKWLSHQNNVECISSWDDLVLCRIVEISKYYIIFILIFFKYKTETANRAETAAWK